ncbi:hypothetical protein [Desulfosporosinus youngiae]|uniref:hypothetical protein n=1 Tax=Desulfosporosinus youngiae TaxID=339862 RepID=UPI0003022A2F|nr:hypothetical protein [Desulfosporosinus youngiae]
MPLIGKAGKAEHCRQQRIAGGVRLFCFWKMIGAWYLFSNADNRIKGNKCGITIKDRDTSTEKENRPVPLRPPATARSTEI